jgi:hypothetical protein
MATNGPKDDNRFEKKTPVVSSTSSLETGFYDIGTRERGEDGDDRETSIEQLFPDLPFPDHQSYFGLSPATSTADLEGQNRRGATGPTVSNESLTSFTGPSDVASSSSAVASLALSTSATSAGRGTSPSSTSPVATTSLILDGNTLHIANVGSTSSLGATSSGAIVPTANTVPEFLYQLTKMLTDNNRDIIEWSNGACTVRLERDL